MRISYCDDIFEHTGYKSWAEKSSYDTQSDMYNFKTKKKMVFLV